MAGSSTGGSQPAPEPGATGESRPAGGASSDAGGDELLARVEDLTLHFDTDRGVVEALEDVSFDVHRGELLALVGETGCGKSVTARSFLQLVPTPPGRYPGGRIMLREGQPCGECGGEGCGACYDTGDAFVDLLSMSTSGIESVRGDRISMIFQDPSETLNPSLRVRLHLAESILAHQGEDVLEEAGVDPSSFGRLGEHLVRQQASADRTWLVSLVSRLPPFREHRAAIREVVRERSIDLLRRTQIPKPRQVLANYPHELSGGQQQRVMIAMALAAQPDLLIADEATTALDVTTQARILELVRDLQDEFETGLLYITHDLTLVSEIADRVAVMYAGNIAETGDVDQVYRDPKHPYTRGLIDSIPRAEKVGTRLEGIEGTVPNLVDPPPGCRFCNRCPEELDHCRDEDPPAVEVAPGHEVACHLYPTD